MARGRKPLEAQRGNLTVAQQVAKQQAEESVTGGREQLLETPDWLVDAIAKAEFQRVVKEMEAIHIIGNLDLTNIACYCNSYAMYRKIVGEVARDPANKELSDALKKHSDEVRKWEALCGLTMDSRLKAGAVKAEEIQDQISQEFGNI